MRLGNFTGPRLGQCLPCFIWVGCFATICGWTRFATALPGTTNLSLLPGASATATGADFGASIEDAIDGNRDGNFNNGSVFYGNAIPESPPLFYEVDLGIDAYIDRVQILRRTDESQGVFGNFRLTIYEDDGAGNPGAVSFTQDYLPTNFVVGTWGTTAPGASAAGGAFGRHVRLERLDNNYWLTFSEFEVIGSTSPLAFTESNNIAAGKPVTTSSPAGFGALSTSGNDGNIDGSFGFPGYRPVYHSSTISVGEYWQVDLGAEFQLDHLQLIARGDHYSTTEFKVSVLNSSQAEVGSFIVDSSPLTDPNPGYDHLINTAGMVGQFIRIETTNEEHLVFTELRAFEGPGSALAGDFNFDGTVDAADYVVWRKNNGSSADFFIWRANFGNTVGSGTAVGQSLSPGSVPEPTSLTLCGLLLGVLTAHRVRTR